MKNKRREFELAAVIGIGSRSVGMDVLELAHGERPVLLESLEREVGLGREVLRAGEVPPGVISLLCGIMADCRRKLDEYPGIAVSASASGALREAANSSLVADLVFQASGIMPEIPCAAAECRRFASAVRRAVPAVSSVRAVAAHIGAWSTHILGFEEGAVRFCEELSVGGDRLPEELEGPELSRAISDLLANSGVLRRLDAAFGGAPELLVAAGRGACRLAAVEERSDGARELTAAEFSALPASGRPEAEACGVANCIAGACGIGRIAVPGFTPRSLPTDGDDEDGDALFSADLAATSSALARRFSVDADLADRRARAAAGLWKKLRPRHAAARHLPALLDAAARLYDVGNCFDGRDSGGRAAFVIGNLLLPGVDDAERRLVAAAVRFAKSGANAPSEDAGALAPEQLPALFRLAALLRVASVLASAGGGASAVRLNIAGGELVVTPGAAATAAERAALAASAPLCVRAFGLAPRFGEVSL